MVAVQFLLQSKLSQAVSAILRKNVLVKKYGDRIGEIVNAEVYQVWKKEVLLLDEEGSELDTAKI